MGMESPENVDIFSTTSLGMQLVTTLTEQQLKGKLGRQVVHGTTFILTFRGSRLIVL
jgi:two-component sensor histidine kinase